MSTDKLAIERLDKIYACTQCKSAFLFKSDVVNHIETTGHGDIDAWPLT